MIFHDFPIALNFFVHYKSLLTFFEKMENADPHIAADFKSKTHLQKIVLMFSFTKGS
jgi:hypothetical protein